KARGVAANVSNPKKAAAASNDLRKNFLSPVNLVICSPAFYIPRLEGVWSRLVKHGWLENVAVSRLLANREAKVQRLADVFSKLAGRGPRPCGTFRGRRGCGRRLRPRCRQIAATCILLR